MKTIIIFLSALFIITFNESNAQQTATKKTNAESVGYKGKVKQVNQSCYVAIDQSGKILIGNRIDSTPENYLIKYDEKGNNTEEYTYNLDGSLCTSFVCKFDDKGNQVEMNGFNSQNYKSIKNYKIIWKYDSSGNVIEMAKYKSNGKGYIKSTYSYWNDVNGNKIRREENTGDFNMFFETIYNDKGYIIEVSQKDKYRGFIYKYTFKYDDKGNQIEIYKYNIFESVTEKVVNIYDDNGNMIEWNVYKPNGSLKNKDVIKLDDKGNVVEENFYKGSDKLIDTHTSEYEYDLQGNWIKKIKFKDNKPESIFIRQIEYYN